MLFRFYRHNGICNKHTVDEGASADDEAVEPFKEKLKNIVADNNVCIADETGLYWKSLPNNTVSDK